MATATKIKSVRPGEEVPRGTISAMIETINALVEMSQSGSGGGGGAGANVSLAMAAMGGGVGGSSPVLTPARLGEPVLMSTGGPAGQSAPIAGASGSLAYWPSQVKYPVIGMGSVTMPDTPLTPYYGRPVAGDEARIYPAKKGSLCFVERYPDPARQNAITVRLYLLPGSPGGEVVARKRCGG